MSDRNIVCAVYHNVRIRDEFLSDIERLIAEGILRRIAYLEVTEKGLKEFQLEPDPAPSRSEA